ncbi:MAG: response regulator, partial [Burkholderiaceae bacterium]
IAAELLISAGITVELANNGYIAVEKIQSGGNYDIVLMDLQMPEMDGYAATAAIRSNPSYATLPILAMTAHAMVEERKLCLDAGMNDHISKPVDPDILFDTLTRWDRRQKRTTAVGKPIEPPVAPPPLLDDWIDTKSALRRIGGNASFYNKMLTQFTATHSQDATLIETSLASGEFDEAKRNLHALRGVAATIGASKLAELARELGRTISSGQEDIALLRRFTGAFDATIAAIDKDKITAPVSIDTQSA